MKKVLYIGNKLSKHGYTPTTIETLSLRFEGKVKFITASDKLNKVYRMFDMLRTIIQNRDAAFLLVDTYSSFAFVFALVSACTARLLGIPYIPILHGGNLPAIAKKRRWIFTFYLRGAYRVVTPSDYLKERMFNVIQVRYEVIPNFLDLYNYRFQVRTPNNPIKLLWVRSFHQIYNPLMLIDIICDLKDLGFDVECAMVGPDKDGTLIQAKSYAAQNNVTEQIKFTGLLSKSEWLKLAEDYDIFLNTTDVDNTPVSVMEAMALGLIVISTNVGGLPYMISDRKDGFLIEAKNQKQFVLIILELINNAALAQSVSECARKKANNWDWHSIELQWHKLLKVV